MLSVTKKKYIFFRFPFLEPDRQQVSPLLTVTPLLCGSLKEPHISKDVPKKHIQRIWFQTIPLHLVTPFYEVPLNGHTVGMLENVGIIWLLKDAP